MSRVFWTFLPSVLNVLAVRNSRSDPSFSFGEFFFPLQGFPLKVSFDIFYS